MPPRWNTWAGLQVVQLDFEKTPKERSARLTGRVAHVGEPVRVRMSGAEIEGQITSIAGPLLHVKVKAAPLKANAAKPKPRRTA